MAPKVDIKVINAVIISIQRVEIQQLIPKTGLQYLRNQNYKIITKAKIQKALPKIDILYLKKVIHRSILKTKIQKALPRIPIKCIKKTIESTHKIEAKPLCPKPGIEYIKKASKSDQKMMKIKFLLKAMENNQKKNFQNYFYNMRQNIDHIQMIRKSYSKSINSLIKTIENYKKKNFKALLQSIETIQKTRESYSKILKNLIKTIETIQKKNTKESFKKLRTITESIQKVEIQPLFPKIELECLERPKEFSISITNFDSSEESNPFQASKDFSDNSEYKRRISDKILAQLAYAINSRREYCFYKWKLILSNQTENEIDYLSVKAIDSSELQYVQSAVEEETKELVENNELLMTIRESNEKPMSPINLFKFLEELMDKKYEADIKDLKDLRNPRTMTEFIQEHLGRVFGISKLANRQLAQIIPALKELYLAKDPYGSIYCKLFQIYDSDPIPFNFAIFITKARYLFQNCINKYEKFVSSNIKDKKKSRGRDLIEDSKSGGYAFTLDVIDLVFNMFESNKQLGILLIQMIRPDAISLEDYVVFLICQRIVRLNKTIEVVFNTIDTDGSGTIEKKELFIFAKNSIDLWVSDKDLEYCFTKLKLAENTDITKEMFMQKFNMKIYLEVTKNKSYIVSKSKFLTSILELYKIFQKIQISDLSAMLHSYPEKLTKAQFSTLFCALNPDLLQKMNKYYLDAADNEGNVPHQNIFKLVLRYGLGKYRKSPFAIPELYLNLEEKKGKNNLDDAIMKVKATEFSFAEAIRNKKLNLDESLNKARNSESVSRETPRNKKNNSIDSSIRPRNSEMPESRIKKPTFEDFIMKAKANEYSAESRNRAKTNESKN